MVFFIYVGKLQYKKVFFDTCPHTHTHTVKIILRSSTLFFHIVYATYTQIHSVLSGKLEVLHNLEKECKCNEKQLPGGVVLFCYFKIIVL